MAKSSEVQVDIKLNTEEIIKELKSVQREAKKATQVVKEFSSLLEDDELVFSLLSTFSNDDLIEALDLREVKMPLNNYSTKDLQNELSKRIGVDTYTINPHGGYAKLFIDNGNQDGTELIEGSAIITVNKN